MSTSTKSPELLIAEKWANSFLDTCAIGSPPLHDYILFAINDATTEQAKRIEELSTTLIWHVKRITEMERILKFFYGRAVPNEHTSDGAWKAMLVRVESLDLLSDPAPPTENRPDSEAGGDE